MDEAGNPMFLRPGLAGILRVEQFLLVDTALDGIEDLFVDQRGVPAVDKDNVFVLVVAAGVTGRIPAEFADVDGVAQDIFDGPVFKPAAAVRALAAFVHPARERKAAFASEVAAEQLFHKAILGRLRHENVILDAVAIRRITLHLAAAVLFLHAALDLLGKVDAVVFVHRLDERFGNEAHAALGHGLGNGDDINAELLAQDRLVHDRIIAVAGKARKLPEQDRVEGLRLRLGDADHAAEFVALFHAAAGNALVHEDEFIRHDIAVARGPLADLDELRGRGELYLVIGGDADIGRGDAKIRQRCGDGRSKALRRGHKRSLLCWEFLPVAGL